MSADSLVKWVSLYGIQEVNPPPPLPSRVRPRYPHMCVRYRLYCRWRTRTEDVTQPFSTLPVVRHRGIDRLPIMPTPLGDSVEGVQVKAK